MNRSIGRSKNAILPPILSSGDKKLLLSIEDFIKTENEKLSAVGQLDVEQKYVIYGQVFDKLIEHCTEYKDILTAIKQEYDEFIEALRKGDIDATHLQAKLRSLTSEPTTLMYYRKRAAELEERIELINQDSHRIERKLQKLLRQNSVKSPPVKEKLPEKDEINPSALIPGMSIEDSLDMSALEKYQQQLDEKKQQLIASMTTKYVPIQRKQELDLKLSLALQEREEAEQINKKLMDSYRKKRVIADAISSWAKSNKNVGLYETLTEVIEKESELKDPAELSEVRRTTRTTKGIPPRKLLYTVKTHSVLEPTSWEDIEKLPKCETNKWRKGAEVELKSLQENKTWTLTDLPPNRKTKTGTTDESAPTNVFDDLEPKKSMEAESLLEYVERFNELLVSGQYKTAAIYAAHSPRGILRNTETMERFKAVVQPKDQDPPLLLFFEAVIGSSNLARHPVNATLTLEGVKCALANDKVDLVVHWVTQQRVTFSEPLGDVIWDYGEKEPQHKVTCLALAQLIYRKCSSLRKAALCMCVQGQIQGVLDYTYQSKRFLLDDYLFLLKKCPTMELINGLTKEWDGKPAVLSVGQAVLSLLCTDHKEYGFKLLENINQCGEDALEQVILNDAVCTAEGWVEIAEECSNNNYRRLSERIMSVVISQDGVMEIPPKDEDAKIMEHVYM